MRWGWVVALIVVSLFLTDAVAQSKRHKSRIEQPSSETSQPESPKQQPRAEQPPVIVNVQPPPKTDSERAEEAEERRHKAELDTQLTKYTGELARFTEKLFYATAVLGIATIGLLVAAFVQSRDAKVSVAATKRLADAAKESADNAVSSNRPFMFMERMQIYFTPAEGHVQYRIQNVGKSVAMLEEYAVDLRIFESLPEKPEYMNVRSSRLAISEREVIPEPEGGELAVPDLIKRGPSFVVVKLPQGDVPLLSKMIEDEKRFRLHLFGYFKYSDVFGKFRQTGFGYDLSKRSPVRIESAAYNYDREIERPEAKQGA